MGTIKAKSIAYCRLQSPDLDIAEQFLTDFGLSRLARTQRTLYMRGTDAGHFIHVTELGPPRYLSLAWEAASEEDLVAISEVPGASGIESPDEPGGGKRVRLTDPMGYTVEVVYGKSALPDLPVSRPANNIGQDRLRRKGQLYRIDVGPAKVKRIGHGVLMTPNLESTVEWYREMLGFLCSDDVYRDDPSNIVGSFNRIDRGDEYVDHHVLYVIRGEQTGLNHVSFEVQDIDDVLVGHEYLANKGYRHAWGVGRHALGSQIFDYWFDPWNRVHEHWTDSDRINSSAKRGIGEAGVYTRGPWGPYPPTNDFTKHASP